MPLFVGKHILRKYYWISGGEDQNNFSASKKSVRYSYKKCASKKKTYQQKKIKKLLDISH